MKVILNFLHFVLFALQERVLLLLFLVQLQHRRWVVGDVLEVDIHLLREFELTPVFNVVHVEPVPHTIVYASDNYNAEDD